MKSVYVTVALLLASAAAPGALAAQQQSQVTLTVTVLDQSGERVAGADLTAEWSGGTATATTGSAGRAQFDVPDGASVAIDTDDDTFLQNVPTVVTASEGRAVTVHVAKKGSATVVVSSTDRGDLSGAEVVFSRDGSSIVRGTTDDGGVFDTGTIERGDYHLEVRKPGYYAVERSVTVGASTTNRVTLDPGTATVEIRVVDDHFDDPRPLDNATVAVESVGEFTTADGTTGTFEIPVNADLDVEVSNDGYESVSRTVSTGESDGTVTVALQRSPALTLGAETTEVDVGQSVEVTVADEYGDPVEGATVSVGETTVGETDADGRASVSFNESGTHNVTAEKDGVTSEPLVVDVADEERTTEVPMTTARSTATATPSTTESTGSGPGFGGALAVLAFATTLALLAGRRRE